MIRPAAAKSAHTGPSAVETDVTLATGGKGLLRALGGEGPRGLLQSSADT